jgi:hypothetical protein
MSRLALVHPVSRERVWHVRPFLGSRCVHPNPTGEPTTMSDQASASTGGTGAPPDPGAANRAPHGLTRAYTGEGIRVYRYVERWNVRLEAYLLLPHDEWPPFSLE